MQVAEVREGYELWRPNRQGAEAQFTKLVIAIVLLASAALLMIITLGGWSRLQSGGVGVITIAWALLYIFFAIGVFFRWQRGVLPLAAVFGVIMIIFAAVAAPGWFARAKDGLESPALPEDLLGLLTLIVIPVQIVLIIVSLVGFNQNWHVEEERPIEGYQPGDDAGAGPDDHFAPAPA